MTDDKKNPLGPSGTQVRRNVTRIREAQGMAKKDLAARTAEVGRPIPPLGISRIEAGTRRVDADDLIALALALNVSPLALLLPATGRGTEPCALTETVERPAAEVWQWADGLQPLELSETDPAGDIQRFQRESRPPYARPLIASLSGNYSDAQWELLSAAGYVRLDDSKGD